MAFKPVGVDSNSLFPIRVMNALKELFLQPDDVSTVAASGKYADLIETPDLIDTGSGYVARPSDLPAGHAFYQGPRVPTDGLLGDRWQPVITPRQVIIDTDWYTDVDDVVAMRLAAHFERIGIFNILACVIDTTAPSGAPSLDAFWRSENRPMQIGQVGAAYSDLTGSGAYQPSLMTLPHYGTDGGVYPDSTTVYRTALASADDGSVDILAIGYLGAIQGLLASPGDTVDARTGVQLVTAKVRRLYVMGGQYPSGSENNFTRSTKAIAAAAAVVGGWPTAIPVYFSGYEIGSTVITGGNLANLVPATDPLYAALVAHGSATGRNSWDPMTILLAAGDPTSAGYTTVRGTNVINATTGANTFTAGGAGPHYYLVKAQADAWYANQINARIVPGREPKPPTTLQVKTALGWRAASAARPLGLTVPVTVGSTDLGALAAIKASDFIGSDGATVASISGANTYPQWVQAASGNQPTYVANSTGRPALRFSGNQWLDTAASLGGVTKRTVYARVKWATLPTSNQTVISDDDGSTYGRSFHLKGISGAIAQAVVFTNGGGVTDNSAASLVSGTWHLLTLHLDALAFEAMIDGSSNGTTAIAQAAQVALETFHLGASKRSGSTATEGLIADVAEVRVYAGFHNTAQMAAIAATM